MKPQPGPLYYRSLAAVKIGGGERAKRRRWRAAYVVSGVLCFVAGFACGALIFGGLLR